MNGILVFDSMPDIAFVHGNEEFRSFLYRRALKDGLLMPNSSSDYSDQLFQNAIVQLFAPLVASQQYMQTKNPYRSIKCQSGLSFIFEMHSGLVYISLNSDKSETESFIRRKINILHKLVHFFHGPVVADIKPKHSSEVGKSWKDLSSILNTWVKLAQDEQCFLVEAVERLHVTPDVSKKAIELLESAVAIFRKAGDKYAVHGLMLARTNLVGLYSSPQASELQPSDVLMLILIMQDYFKCSNSLEDLMAFPSAKIFGLEEKMQTLTETLTTMKLDEDNEGDDENSEDSPQYYSVSSDSDTESTSAEPSARQARSTLRSESVDSRVSMDERNQGTDYHCKNVYLNTQYCKYQPHSIHCMQIYPGLTLIFISEITRSKQIGTLCMLFNILADFLSEKPSGGKYKLERLESIVKKLLEALKKFKGQTQRISADIQKNFEYCKNNGLNQWLETGCSTELSMGLESSIKQLDKILKKLFLRLSITMTEIPEVIINTIKEIFIKEMADYRSFLAVKSQRNITMTSYIEEFPGLVHFIYVDRKYDNVFAPSINILSEPSEGLDATQMIKTKIWQMVRWCQEKLQNGYIAATKLEGDYYYSYYLWFEDVSGNPLIVQKEYTANSVQGPPGLISSKFYKKLVRHCFPQAAQRSVLCYEIMCIHMGIVPPDLTVKHCRKLAASLWETSGEINSTVNLL